MPATIHALPSGPLVRRNFRRGLRRYTMLNEAMAYYNAHPEEWAELTAMIDESIRRYGPPDVLPRYTRATLRGEIFPQRQRT